MILTPWSVLSDLLPVLKSDKNDLVNIGLRLRLFISRPYAWVSPAPYFIGGIDGRGLFLKALDPLGVPNCGNPPEPFSEIGENKTSKEQTAYLL